MTVLAVVIACLLPADSPPLQLLGTLRLSDKVLHFGAYAVLAFLPVLYERLRTALAIAACLVLLGVLVEFGQSYTATRLFEVKDIIADGGGVLFGLLAGLPRRI